MKRIAKSFLKTIFVAIGFMVAGCGGGTADVTSPSNRPAVSKVLPAPVGITATSGINKVTIRWDPVAGADSYNIYWSTEPGVTPSSGTRINCAAREYQHVGLTCRGYFYVVTAVNSIGESVASNQAYTIAAADSANLYATYCASCHGEIVATNIMGGTPEKIAAAIAKNTGEMAALSFLTPEQISVISKQLPCH